MRNKTGNLTFSPHGAARWSVLGSIGTGRFDTIAPERSKEAIMTNKLMLGVAISALMVSGAFAQSTPPSSSTQMKPPAAAPAKPNADAPAAKMDKQPAAKPESSAEKKSDKAKTSDQAAAPTGNDAGGKPQVVASQSPDEFLASNFKGTDVIGSDNKKIGDVADILFEKDGTIKAYVISFGGFLGMGAKEVAIAPTAFEVVPGEKGGAKKLKLAMSQNDLKSAQKFTEYQPPKPAATTTGCGQRDGRRAAPCSASLGRHGAEREIALSRLTMQDDGCGRNGFAVPAALSFAPLS